MAPCWLHPVRRPRERKLFPVARTETVAKLHPVRRPGED